MAEAMLARRQNLGVAIETTKGTAENVTAIDTLLVYNIQFSAGDQFADGERRANSQFASTVEHVRGAQTGTLSFTTELLPGDATFTKLLKGCGFSVGVVTVTSTATPTLVQSVQETLTLAVWEDGRKKVLFGAAGTFRIMVGGAAQRVMCEWTFTGKFTTVIDQAMPSMTVISTKGYRAESTTLTLASAAIPYIDDWSLDMQCDVQPREDVTDPTGIRHFIVADITPLLTMAPAAQLVANYDAFGKFFAGTAEALSMAMSDHSGDFDFTITAPKAQRRTIGVGERNTKLTDPVEFVLHQSTGADAVSLVEVDNS